MAIFPSKLSFFKTSGGEIKKIKQYVERRKPKKFTKCQKSFRQLNHYETQGFRGKKLNIGQEFSTKRKSTS